MRMSIDVEHNKDKQYAHATTDNDRHTFANMQGFAAKEFHTH